MCGGSGVRIHRPRPPRGLSPRVRGKLQNMPPIQQDSGSIPACAGEARLTSMSARPFPVYPRVCGGSAGNPGFPTRTRGLSPRVRGKRAGMPRPGWATRSIPACAGEAPHPRYPPGRAGVYPRVCGGSELTGATAQRGIGLSPRVRGKRCRFRRQSPNSRSIPACAGEAQ